MQQIKTEIIINAPRKRIWNILMDFHSYPEWNPFVQSLNGEQKLGGKLQAKIGLGDSPMTFKPTVKEFDEEVSFAWLGRLFLPKLFDGYHSFRLEEIGENTTRFIHSERFYGLLVWPIMKMIRDDTISGFEQMNQSLKQRAEAEEK